MEIFSKCVYKYLNKKIPPPSSFLHAFASPTLTIFVFLPPPPLFFKFRRCSRRCPAAWADPLFSSTVSHSSPFFFNFFAVFVFRRTRRRTAVVVVRFGHILVYFMLSLLCKVVFSLFLPLWIFCFAHLRQWPFSGEMAAADGGYASFFHLKTL